jgi:hypothetical protein
MSSAADYPAQASVRNDLGGYVETARGTGWVSFAACLLGLAGCWNTIDGFLAIYNSHVYAENTVFVFSDLKTWGWILLIGGILQLIAAFAVLGGSELARWFGVAIAGLNALLQLAYIPAQPWWAISMLALDLAVIYGLVVYGGSRLREA